MIIQEIKCTKCEQFKTQIYNPELDTRLNQNGKKWKGLSVCPDCTYSKYIKKNIPKIPDPIPFIFEDVKCLKCEEIKYRCFIGRYESKAKIFKAKDGRNWSSSRCCPDCVGPTVLKRKLKQGKNILKIISCFRCGEDFKQKSHHNLYCIKCQPLHQKEHSAKKRIKTKTCLRCSKEFITSKKSNYCSEQCKIKPKKLKIYKEPKKYIKVEYIEKSCETCGKLFKPKSINHVACKPSHTIRAKELRRLHKRLKEFRSNRIPKWANKDKIGEWYRNCPKGCYVDHIIPLNHPDILGLHVETNFQYLTIKENTFKSNKWDGTKENEGWRQEYIKS